MVMKLRFKNFKQILIMKILSILFFLWFLSSSSMPANFGNAKKECNIIITQDKMTIKTVLPGWNVQHNILIKQGENTGYYVLMENMSFEYKITKY